MLSNIDTHVQHPGYFIEEELLARGWTQTDLAYIMGMSTQQLNPILKGKHGISADMALLLSDAFNMPPVFFANLENDYQLSKAKIAPPGVKKRALWQSTYPVREMIRRGWIEEDDPTLLDAQMLRFFEANNIDHVPFMGARVNNIAFAAKKSNQTDPTPDELAWLYRVRQIAKTLVVPSYSRDKLVACLETLKSLRSSREDVTYLPELLNSCGVRFLIVEALPKSKFDGVCTWIDHQPVVALTNRYDRLDNFWFVIRHEIEHVLQEHGIERGFSDIDNLDSENRSNNSSIAEEEKIANDAASDFCIPTGQLNSFIARKNPYFSEKDIIGFAARLEVHPALVVGQLQFALQKWTLLRKYLQASVAGVRELLVPELEKINAVDGWEVSAIAHL
jgi:HTH-type transcriptional regulator/antitoxin HigA